MMTTDQKTDAYTRAMVAGLPQGAAFPRAGAPNRDALIRAIAREFAVEDDGVENLLREASPLTATVMIEEWETDFALPDCDHQHAATLQERRAAIHEKRTRVGSLNPNAIITLAKKLGYDAEVIERRPFITGMSRCGDRLGSIDNRFWWSVRVYQARLTRFRAGLSRCGEKLSGIARANDLVCVLERINHSHMKLTFSYQGN